MELDQLLWECFRHFVFLDHSNAAVHTALVRYSPITFRLAEALEPYIVNRDVLHPINRMIYEDVMNHKGQYEEDSGR